ncbi:hypothetical protein [Streptomyces melanogenes]|uniref:hypothetical protein n=1 Tax=Streptomyces melanogenes TaxID=67326 RepID=UPI00167EFCD0|nr:hypothetical protein [Streptomyces melanogenes]GGP93083.1 hypothetical protein GCM10010278_83860 [Streptomyces melanogenes]
MPPGSLVLAALQHQQLYDPAFPARWRRRVLARIARRTASAKSGALAVADASGVDTADMTGEQLSFWLTPYEQGDLSRTEALAKIMVRSARLDGAWSVWPASWTEAPDLLEDAAATVAAVTAAYLTNAEVEAADPRHSIAHLAIRWELRAGAGRAERDAAARDRAFRDFAGAIEVVARAFYLRASLGDAGSAARDSPRI